ncbi:MAG: hypothetical protein H0V09_10160 [Gemmatimonadetes bacterium]|nr:hypothetical protein [Gemmatimonadota bacterium]
MTPSTSQIALERQAFAWNPSISGAKIEDTVLCTSSGPELLTEPSRDWPMLQGEWQGRRLPRADILVR